MSFTLVKPGTSLLPSTKYPALYGVELTIILSETLSLAQIRIRRSSFGVVGRPKYDGGDDDGDDDEDGDDKKEREGETPPI